MMNSRYRCEICGEVHADYPALTYPTPDSYYFASDKEKQNAFLNEDFCAIELNGETFRFIRVVLKQKIQDSDLTLDYGLWVSLSEKSYNDYYSNFNNENHETKYFGWLNSTIPEYSQFEISVPTTVITKLVNERPEIIPHDDFEHPLVKDYYNGIKKKEAEKRVHDMLSKINT